MAISKIKTGSLTDSAVNTDKLAPGSVGSTDLSATVISGQAELSETAADTDFTIIYDTSAGTLKKVLRSNLKQAGPTFSSISPTNVDTGVGATTSLTITGTGFTAGSNARLVDNSGKIVEFTTVTRNSSTQITAVVTHSDLDTAQSPYDIQITNGEGISSLSANQLDVNAAPIWITSAGSLGTESQNTAFSVDIQAYDPDSTSIVSYELQSGTLPPGLTLSSGSGDIGTISGTTPSVDDDTTYNFTIRALDAASNTTSRSFSITVEAVRFQVFTSSGTFSVPASVSSVDVLVVAGGGGGANDGGGGGGAGGLIYRPGFPVTPSGTVSVTVGDGGAGALGGPQPAKVGGDGQDSVFGTLTAKGGGGAGGGDCFQAGRPGGSGGGTGGNLPAGQIGGSAVAGGSAIQPTQPGDSGAYGFGNPGGEGQRPSNLNQYAGGGGGAAVSGQPGPDGSDGGNGKAYTIADGTTPVYYAGGGAGSHGVSPYTPACGGQGGGGNGGSGPNVTSGTANRGGGGGGPSSTCYPGSGGKGIVIVRWGV